MEYIAGIITIVFGILYAYGRYKGWLAVEYRNQAEGNREAADEWRNYGKTANENAELDRNLHDVEDALNDTSNTDDIIKTDEDSGNWKQPNSN